MRQWVTSGAAAQWALIATFFSLPLSKPAFFLCLTAAGILFAASNHFAAACRNIRLLPWVPAALALAALPLLSVFIHGYSKDAELNLSYYWIAAVIVYLASGRLPVRPWIWAFAAGVFVVFCYVQAFFPGRVEHAKGLAALGNYILYSQFLAIGVVLLSILHRHEERRGLKLVCLAGMAFFFYGLVSGDGRSGLVSLLILLPMVIGNLFVRSNRRMILIGCLVGVTLVVMSPRVQKRIDAGINDIRLMQQDQHNTSLGYRYDMWRTALDVIVEYPVLGAGPNGFGKAWHRRHLTPEAVHFVEPHNAFLFYAASFGLVGLASLLWLYAAMLWTGWRCRHSMEGSVVFAFSVICVAGSLTNTMFMGAVSLGWMMLFIGLQGSLQTAFPKPVAQARGAAA